MRVAGIAIRTQRFFDRILSRPNEKPVLALLEEPFELIGKRRLVTTREIYEDPWSVLAAVGTLAGSLEKLTLTGKPEDAE